MSKVVGRRRRKGSGKEVERRPGNEKEGRNKMKVQTMEWKGGGKEVKKRWKQLERVEIR